MRVMIDSNILDHLDADAEARDELINRRDILLLVTPAQEREIAAIPDHTKRDHLQGIMKELCRRLALPPTTLPSVVESPVREAVSADDGIVAVAVSAGCDLLVSEDIEVLNKALAAGTRVMDWKLFLERVVWGSRQTRRKS
jgi:predicted nucleic acid-binding protein